MEFSWFRRFTKRTLVLVNLLLAVLFLLGCYVSWFDPRYFWFLGFLNLGSFYLLLALVFFIFFWLFVKTKFSLIGLIAFLLAWVPLKHLIKIRFPGNFAIQKKEGSLRVMNWNVEHFAILENKTHPEKKEQMLNLIRQYQPDVICMQEAVVSDSISGAINYLPDIMTKLGMGYYHYSYNKKIDFDSKHRFGILLLSKYPLASRHTLSYEPYDYNSIFQYADVIKGQDTIRLFNLHLQSLKFSDTNRYYIENPVLESKEDLRKSKNVISKLKKGFLKRYVQSNRIRKSIESSPYPVIVCGDFNDVPNSYAYNTIGKGLKNAFAEKGSGIGRTFFSISPTLRIDHIFADGHFNVEQFIRLRRTLSDHFPIIADLSYKKTDK
ncbi:MAG: endonuclease/exonuclease/phosphatase family protein [Ferruginibacter sp.]